MYSFSIIKDSTLKPISKDNEFKVFSSKEMEECGIIVCWTQLLTPEIIEAIEKEESNYLDLLYKKPVYRDEVGIIYQNCIDHLNSLNICNTSSNKIFIQALANRFNGRRTCSLGEFKQIIDTSIDLEYKNVIFTDSMMSSLIWQVWMSTIQASMGPNCIDYFLACFSEVIMAERLGLEFCKTNILNSIQAALATSGHLAVLMGAILLQDVFNEGSPNALLQAVSYIMSTFGIRKDNDIILSNIALGVKILKEGKNYG